MGDPLMPTIEVTEEGVEVRAPAIMEDTSSVELLPLQGMLGLEQPGARQRSQMKEVWDYFAKDAQGTGDALFKIKQTEMKMSPPRLGESRLGKLHTFVRSKTALTNLEEQIALL